MADIFDAIKRILEEERAKAAFEREQFIAKLPTDFDRVVTRKLLERTDAVIARAAELVFGFGMSIEAAAELANDEFDAERGN